MIRPADRARAAQITQRLEHSPRALPGISAIRARDTFVEQVLESIRRIEYLKLIASRPISPSMGDPTAIAFDPLKAAVLKHRAGEIDDAWWLVFLAAHFGRHRRTKWRLAADVYGQLGSGSLLTWHKVSAHPQSLQLWLQANEEVLRRGPNRGLFGNHRKYESVSASSARGSGRVVESYVSWVGANRGHQLMFADVTKEAPDRFEAFDAMYRAMDQVLSFGRTGRFDYLTLLGNLGFAPIEPGIPYLNGATGPLSGAKLLFGGSTDAAISTGVLSDAVVQLGSHAGLGMQVLEDSLCNWQKNPTQFVAFRG